MVDLLEKKVPHFLDFELSSDSIAIFKNTTTGLNTITIAKFLEHTELHG